MNKYSSKYILFLICIIVGNSTVFAQNKKLSDQDEQGMEFGNLDLSQDSVAVIDALNGWWKKSNESLEERMSWYNHAKFGCFIHWGVYSSASGVWNGRIVTGYSEHLMRKEQISLEEYKEKLVYPFNPSEFDADEWMRNVRAAGMRYFIITAKHHDGFAMYFSDAYPYDIRLSKFKRDPMRELRDAAKKYGIKFGFYYSHAFDWEHPDAPGNDWMYDNPGGDKLLWGKNWWNENPDFLNHSKKYVAEKSIPQILELIANYQPDILWFDTPHKLPLFENIQILKAIREKAPNVVVNGRLVRFAKYNLGDYKNTGDRAAYFPPVEGYWESIPTTNESYGFSKHDLSHKSVKHFVQLLASATAKGGNILMNVGPMGNGKWDIKDVEIFNGIGKWLKINGKAIYGNTKTDLPLQSWGVTTQKKDTVYLHVFNWPSNGKLVVGGLTSDVEKAWLISDVENKNLKFSRINKNDFEVKIPKNPNDTLSTVIALKIKKHQIPNGVRLIDANNENILYTFDADLNGKGFSYGDGKPSRNYVGGWKDKNQTIFWNFRNNQTRDYTLSIDYNTNSEQDSGQIEVLIDGLEFKVDYLPHIERNGIKNINLGQLNLKKGNHTCTLIGVERIGSEFMRPISIRLNPILN